MTLRIYVLGAAFAGVGLVSAAFAVPRRQRDPLLICFASFGVSYGLRLWISSPMLAMIAQVRPSTHAYVEPLSEESGK